ncbi:MAG TPA: hypothetical protein VL614_26390 [Acetobacteraceae bacterium]|nr:hypothetical protein [Acetobacteraceae bacterium]
MRTIAEPLDMPQRVAIGRQKVFVLEDASSKQTGLAQIKQFAALA